MGGMGGMGHMPGMGGMGDMGHMPGMGGMGQMPGMGGMGSMPGTPGVGGASAFPLLGGDGGASPPLLPDQRPHPLMATTFTAKPGQRIVSASSTPARTPRSGWPWPVTA